MSWPLRRALGPVPWGSQEAHCRTHFRIAPPVTGGGEAGHLSIDFRPPVVDVCPGDIGSLSLLVACKAPEWPSLGPA